MKWIVFLLALALVGCNGVPKAPERSRVPLFVPAGGDAYLRFEPGQALLVENGAASVAAPAPAHAGAPAAVSTDLGGEYAVVAYDGALARVRLAERSVDWMSIGWSAAPGAIAVSGSRALAIAGTRVVAIDLSGDLTAEVSDAAPWMKEHDIDVLLWAQPIGASQMLLAGASDRGAAGQEAIVQRVETKSGAWSETENKRIGEIHRLHACGSDGVALVLAGVREQRERTTPGSLSAASLRQTLTAVSIDLATLGFRTVVREPRAAVDTRVIQVVTGGELVALVLDGGELSVHRIEGHGPSAQPAFARAYGQPISAAWIDADKIAVLGARDGRVRIETIP